MNEVEGKKIYEWKSYTSGIISLFYTAILCGTMKLDECIREEKKITILYYFIFLLKLVFLRLFYLCLYNICIMKFQWNCIKLLFEHFAAVTDAC